MNNKHLDYINYIEDIGNEGFFGDIRNKISKFLNSQARKNMVRYSKPNIPSPLIIESLVVELMPKLDELANSTELKHQLMDTVIVTDVGGSITGSKLGGIPYWPNNVRDKNDLKDCELIAQIRLEDLPFNPYLPRKGILQFFSGIDEGHGPVIYHSSIDETMTTEKSLENLKDDDHDITYGEFTDTDGYGKAIKLVKSVGYREIDTLVINKLKEEILNLITEVFNRYPEFKDVSAELYVSNLLFIVSSKVYEKYQIEHNNMFGFSLTHPLEKDDIVLLQLVYGDYLMFNNEHVCWVIDKNSASKKDFNKASMSWNSYPYE